MNNNIHCIPSKAIVITSLLVLFLQCAFAQNKQTYNGNFNSANFHGTANYQYYEDNSQQRIYDGLFAFNAKSPNGSVNITGSFSNSQKNGVWNIKLVNVPTSDIIMKYLVTSTVSASFKNGNLDGRCTLNRKKTISFSNSGISQYYLNNLNALSYLFDGKTIDNSQLAKTSYTVTEKSNVSFKENHFVGVFSYNVNEDKSKVLGQFNDAGYFDGIWNISYYQDKILHTEIRDYQNGFLLTIKTKDNSTGDIRTIYDKTSEIKTFLANYDSVSNSAKVDDKFYTIENCKTPTGNTKFLNDAISIWSNNSSLSESVYLLEIPKGANKITQLAERKVVYDALSTQKYNEEKERKEEANEKEQEKIKEDNRMAQIAKENAERREKQEEERKKNEFERSDMGRLRNEIKRGFTAWMEKKQFETNEDYKNRITEKAVTEFNSIVQNTSSEAKQRYVRMTLSASLRDYDIDQQTFQVEMFQDYNKFQTAPIYISVPKNLAENLKSKFDAPAKHGLPMLAHFIDASIVNNRWTPSKIIFIFPNQGSRSGSNYNKPYYDNMYWNETHIEENSKGQYTLAYASNISLKPCKLKDIHSQFENNTLDDGLFFYVWQVPNLTTLDITMESLGIELPKF